jgi:hypothetical protein
MSRSSKSSSSSSGYTFCASVFFADPSFAEVFLAEFSYSYLLFRNANSKSACSLDRAIALAKSLSSFAFILFIRICRSSSESNYLSSLGTSDFGFSFFFLS